VSLLVPEAIVEEYLKKAAKIKELIYMLLFEMHINTKKERDKRCNVIVSKEVFFYLIGTAYPYDSVEIGSMAVTFSKDVKLGEVKWVKHKTEELQTWMLFDD
jgi:hypothetical protein